MYTKVVLLLTLYISVLLNLSFGNEFLSAQVNEIIDNNTNNGSNQSFTLDNNASRGIGIMHNTTGIIDDAFNALKDSFGSFFGK